MKKLVPEFRYIKKEVQFQKYGCYPKEIKPNIHFFLFRVNNHPNLILQDYLRGYRYEIPYIYSEAKPTKQMILPSERDT